MSWPVFMEIWDRMAAELQQDEPVSFPVPRDAKEIAYGPPVNPETLRPMYAVAGVSV